jgi:hypothetical protein
VSRPHQLLSDEFMVGMERILLRANTATELVEIDFHSTVDLDRSR